MIRISEPHKCTGCGVCSIVCPCDAIQMEEDIYGFEYPQISQNKCINCGKCIKSCPENSPLLNNEPINTFAAQGNNESILLQCASGGAFYYIAKAFIEGGGIVYGCMMSFESGCANLFHTRIDKVKDLDKIVGSKYAQSESYKSFFEIQQELKKARKVLFASTPCQVFALKAYLGTEYENLYTADIFCHGNTNRSLLNKYIQYLSNNEKSTISQYVFRDKTRGKGYKAKYKVDRTGKYRMLSTYQEAYWYLFQNSKILRLSCYTCRYSSKNRVGDISLGDFWGIEKTRPDLMKSKGLFNPRYGISAVIINSTKGDKMISSATELITAPCELINIEKYGDAIRCSADLPDDRESVLNNYVNKGYAKVQMDYKKALGFNYYKFIIREYPIVEKILSMIRKR